LRLPSRTREFDEISKRSADFTRSAKFRQAAEALPPLESLDPGPEQLAEQLADQQAERWLGPHTRTGVAGIAVLAGVAEVAGVAGVAGVGRGCLAAGLLGLGTGVTGRSCLQRRSPIKSVIFTRPKSLTAR
jgi:hypothetical protein